MAFCFVIGIAGGTLSQRSALADALCNTYSHRTVIHLKMEDYYKPKSSLFSEALPEAMSGHNDPSPESYNLSRLRDDVEEILWNVHCRILVVEGSLIFQHKGIEELLDLRVYINDPSLDDTEDYSKVSRENADLLLSQDSTAEDGAMQIKNTLWGLWL